MDIDVMFGMVCGYGADQLFVGIVVSVITALVKRKIKLDLRRELAIRLIFSLALAAIAGLILAKNYGWIISTASGGLGLSYVLTNLVCKGENPTAETFLRSVAPYLTDEQIKSVTADENDEEQTRDLLKTLLRAGVSDEQILFFTDVIIALKKIG